MPVFHRAGTTPSRSVAGRDRARRGTPELRRRHLSTPPAASRSTSADAELEEIKDAVQPDNILLVVRRDDRPGRGAHRGRVRSAPRARRLHPDQARRRRARRRGALDQGGHRQADQVPRHGRGARQARGVPARGPREPHPRLRRHRRPDEGLRGGRRRGRRPRRTPQRMLEGRVLTFGRLPRTRSACSRRWDRSRACSRGCPGMGDLLDQIPPRRSTTESSGRSKR